MSKKREDLPQNLKESIHEQLDKSFQCAMDIYLNNNKDDFFKDKLNEQTFYALDDLIKNQEKASTAFCNIITSLTIKALLKEKVDIRYHQVQIQSETTKGAGFNFRSISEYVIYPWMSNNDFKCAKSGWQTRTFERPKPYTLDYAENIGYVKDSFLQIYHQIEENNQSAFFSLAYIMVNLIIQRETTRVILATPNINDVLQIVSLFEQHFNYKYQKSKGASRLPVLALYSIYQVLIDELGRYKEKELKPLEAHSAADSQTGAVGDIEVINQDNNVFEALEIKHQIKITLSIIESVKQKIMGNQIDRYYILTTHNDHEPSTDILNEVENIKKRLGCQLIVNGVIPTIKYYLRLISSPSLVIKNYTQLLDTDSAIEYEHKVIWNKIATGDN